MEGKKKYKKEYTRDTSMIIQQGWNGATDTPLFFEEQNPYAPSNINYMNDGMVEIWENEHAAQWFMDTLQEIAQKDESIIHSILDTYEEDLRKMEIYWKSNLFKDAEKFDSYLDEVYEVMRGFAVMYYSALDERTPESIKNRVLPLRNSDVYFDENDKLIRASLIEISPETKGCETPVLRNEIKEIPSQETLEERKKSFVFIGLEYAEQQTLQEFVEEHIEYEFEIETVPKQLSELRGQVGNKGFVRGPVRIMKHKDQIGDTQEGDILVSTMTTPDFVPAMKKAAAFVTDEGGIMCHAAIIAREMNKPCVIGTKFATEVLKDGDMVEVDADKGLVKKLD